MKKLLVGLVLGLLSLGSNAQIYGGGATSTATFSSTVYAPNFVASSGASTFAGTITSGFNGGMAIGSSVGNVTGFGRNGSTGGMQFFGGVTVSPVDGNADGGLASGSWSTTSGGAYGWTSSATNGSSQVAKDTAFSRLSASTVGLGDGTAGATNGALVLNNITIGGAVTMGKTVTAAGSTGAKTINTATGTVNFAAAATSLVVTNNQVSTTSITQCTVGTNDTTMKSVQCVAAAGSFTIFANAAATAETRVNFTVTN